MNDDENNNAFPPLNTTRWTAERKAAVVRAVVNHQISRATAQRWWGLSPEELAAWERDYAINGVAGLRATKRQQYYPSNKPAERKGRRSRKP